MRDARRAVGKTQAQAARALGINTQTVSDYERGRTRIPADVLQGLCALYGITPGEFLDGSPSNDELSDIRETLRRRPSMRMLFSVTKNATEEDIRKAVAIIEALNKENNSGVF